MPSHPDRVRANYDEPQARRPVVSRMITRQLFEQCYIDMLRYEYELARRTFEQETGRRPTFVRIEVF